jgi:hypothetical protein
LARFLLMQMRSLEDRALMYLSATPDHAGGIVPAAKPAAVPAPAAGGAASASFADTLAASPALQPHSGGREGAPAPGSRLARPDNQGNIYSQPALKPGRGDQPNGSTQVATHAPQDYSLSDLLDIVNPLQQLPIVGTVYRALTGDTIKPEMRIMGGALYGGPIGLALAIGDTMVEQVTGRDTGGNLVALIDPERAPITRRDGAPTMVAEAETAKPAEDAPKATLVAATIPGEPSAPPQPDDKPHPAPAPPAEARTYKSAPAPETPRTLAGVAPAASNGAKAPEMSAAAFDALMKSIGATPIDGGLPGATKAAPEIQGDAAIAKPVSLVEGAAQPASGDASGIMMENGVRFFPANRMGPPGQRAIPLAAQPKTNYDDALVAMKRAMDKYQGMGTRAAAESVAAGAKLDARY